MGRKWKSVLCIAVLIAILALLSGCGKDGLPGNAYLGVWVDHVQADELWAISYAYLPPASSLIYGFTNGLIPISYPAYYQQLAGTYYFQYQLRYWSVAGAWVYSPIVWGYLTIQQEPGTPGSFPFIDGANGADSFYDWVLGWTSSDIYISSSQSAKAAAAGGKASTAKITTASTQVTSTPPDPALYDIGPKHVVTKSDGVRRITITEYSYTPKGTVAEPSKNATTTP
jgi:hypothetical protein